MWPSLPVVLWPCTVLLGNAHNPATFGCTVLLGNAHNLPQSAVVKGRGSAQCCWELHTILPQQLWPSRYSWVWPCTMPLGMHTMMQQPGVAAPAGRLGSTAQRDGIWVSPLCNHSGLAFGAIWCSPDQSKHRKEQIRASSPRGNETAGMHTVRHRT